MKTVAKSSGDHDHNMRRSYQISKWQTSLFPKYGFHQPETAATTSQARWIRLHICALLIISILSLHAQDSLQTNELFSVKPKYLIPQHHSEIQFQQIDLNFQNFDMPSRYYYTPDHLQQNPFSIDTRSGSYYTPRLVRDELNNMMYRPKDHAFVPVLGVAFIALQMASKYLLVARELQIKPENILNSQKQLPILEALWDKSPQTCNELYTIEKFKRMYSYKTLENDIMQLVDQKLVKSRRMENDEVQYYPAIERSTLQHTLQTGRKDSLTLSSQKSQIDSLLIYFDTSSR